MPFSQSGKGFTAPYMLKNVDGHGLRGTAVWQWNRPYVTIQVRFLGIDIDPAIVPALATADIQPQ